jgi:hypothetical protein
MLCDAFWEHSLSTTAVFDGIHVSRPVKWQSKMTNVLGEQALAKEQKMLKKFERSVMEFATRS